MADPSSMFDRLARGRQEKPQQQPEQPKAEPKRKRQGKRSDPSFTQVGAYIPKELNDRVKRQLFDDPRDFSELVTDLLEEWLKQQID